MTTFLRTVGRTLLGAAVLAAVLVPLLPRRQPFGWDYFDALTVAFCFTFFGHYVDAMLGSLPGIGTSIGRIVRVARWFAGGLWCYVVARYVWAGYGRDIADLPPLIYGGLLLVGLQLVVHAGTKLTGDRE